jgi:DNA polymerase V
VFKFNLQFTILKAANLKEEARTIARNSEIGGHKA